MEIPFIHPQFFAYECKVNKRVFCTLCRSSGLRIDSRTFLLYRVDGFEGRFCSDCVKLIFKYNF